MVPIGMVGGKTWLRLVIWIESALYIGRSANWGVTILHSVYIGIHRYTKYGKGKVIAELPDNLNFAPIPQTNAQFGEPMDFPWRHTKNTTTLQLQVQKIACLYAAWKIGYFYGSCIFSLSETDVAQEWSSLVHMHTYTFLNNWSYYYNI